MVVSVEEDKHPGWTALGEQCQFPAEGKVTFAGLKALVFLGLLGRSEVVC